LIKFGLLSGFLKKNILLEIQNNRKIKYGKFFGSEITL
jgi:hypothetical protein